MSLPAIEECPVCWRPFSSALTPLTIPCGHSFCPECSQGLSQCALCRKRLVHGYPRVKNYSLLSLIERLTTTKTTQRHQEAQTEKPTAIRREAKKTLEECPLKLLAKPLNVKFHKDPLGGIKRVEFKFK